MNLGAVWTGTELIIRGGNAVSRLTGTRYDDGAAYSRQNQTWRPLPAAPLSTRLNHSAVWTGTEMIVFGGTEGTLPSALDVETVNDGARYLPRC